MKKNTREQYYLLNYVVVLCVILLFLNDHFFKQAYPNWLTGKLSDAAGIILLPMLLAFCFPRLHQNAIWLSALLFTFWKSPYAQGAIDVYNDFSIWQTSRVVDGTDLYVLLLLPIPHFIIGNINNLKRIKINKLHPLVVLAPTIVTLLSTSPPPRYYFIRSTGNLRCYRCAITVNYDQDEIVAKLKKANISFDSVGEISDGPGSLRTEHATAYRIDQFVIDKDTLRKLDLCMRTRKPGKTTIYFAGMQVADSLSTEKLRSDLLHYYKTLLFKTLKNGLQN